MTQEDLISEDIWFAWYPVRTVDRKWAWLQYVRRTIDERPEYYQGLLPINRY